MSDQAEQERLRAIVSKVDYDMYHLDRARRAEAERDAAQRDLAHQEDLTDRQRARTAELERGLAEAEAERDALRTEVAAAKDGQIEVLRENVDLQAEVERLRAALREIEETTDGIPEQNCMIANRIARLALRGDTAPAEEKRGYAPTDALGDARAEAAEPRCVRCGSRYSPGGACSRSAEGCQGGRGEWTVCIPPACPHGHPPGSARDCACHDGKP